MSNRSGFFARAADPQRRNHATRRSSDRETQRRTPAPAARNGSNPRADTGTQIRSSIHTAIASKGPVTDVSLSAPRLGSSDTWESFKSFGGLQTRGPTDATEQTSTFLQTCVKKTLSGLGLKRLESTCIAREQFHVLLEAAAQADEPLRFRATQILANVYQQLGDYDRAQTTLQSICPSLPLSQAAFGDLLAWHRIDALLAIGIAQIQCSITARFCASRHGSRKSLG